MTEALTTRRIGYDIDDTLVWRDWAARFIGRFKSQKLPDLSLVNLPMLNHTPVNKGGGRANTVFLSKRKRRDSWSAGFSYS